MDGDGANKKRGTERQLTKDNYKEDEGEGDEEPGDFARATEEALKTRNIRRVRRAPPAPTTTGPNPFAGISLTGATPSNETNPRAESAAQEETTAPVETEQETVPLETINETDKESENQEEEKGETDEPKQGALFSDVPSISFSAPVSEAIPSTSAVDSSRFQLVDMKSGEEEEETVFSEKAGLYTNVDGKWNSVGSGEVKINVDANGKARVIMRQGVTLQLLLNARLYPEMKPLPMGDNAVTFSCQNYLDKAGESEKEDDGKRGYDICAIRFKYAPTERAQSFKEAIEKHKNGGILEKEAK